MFSNEFVKKQNVNVVVDHEKSQVSIAQDNQEFWPHIYKF